jgi:DNA-binding GntR family transcriptional regulator
MALCGVTELRLLVELAAIREVTDRGFGDAELETMRRLANATVRSARRNDARGFLDADISFHAYLPHLTGNSALLGIERLLLSREPGGEDTHRPLLAAANEHAALVNLLADDLISAASDLLRHHICAGPTPPLGDPAETMA